MAHELPPRHRGPGRASALMLFGLLLAAPALQAAGPGLPTLPGAVDTHTLHEQRARQGVTNVQLGQVYSHINLSNNQVIGGQTGNNFLGAGAFGNASGFSMLIQNTGNNVAIQESMVVNISINP